MFSLTTKLKGIENSKLQQNTDQKKRETELWFNVICNKGQIKLWFLYTVNNFHLLSPFHCPLFFPAECNALELSKSLYSFLKEVSAHPTCTESVYGSTLLRPCGTDARSTGAKLTGREMECMWSLKFSLSYSLGLVQMVQKQHDKNPVERNPQPVTSIYSQKQICAHILGDTGGRQEIFILQSNSRKWPCSNGGIMEPSSWN